MPSLARLATLALITTVACYLVALALLWVRQETLLFPAPQPPRTPKLAGAELLRLASGSGEVVALHLPAPPGAPTAVFFHGNGEQLDDVTEFLAALRSQGLGALGVEYPGYGVAPGRPSEPSAYAAAERALEHLREQGVGADRTLLVGYSVGSGIAAEMAVRGRGARLALLAAYTSIAEVAQPAMPMFPVRLMLRNHFETAKKAPAIRLPVLLIHGTDDPLIPAEMSRRLATLFPNASLQLIEGAEHGLFAGRDHALARCIAAFARGERCGLVR